MDSLALDLVLEPSLNRTFIRSILAGGNPEALIGKKLIVGGWVKMGREQGKGSFAFMELNDESCGVNLQVIVDGNVFPLDQLTATSTCVLIEGELKKPPEGTKQDVGMRAERVIHIGPTHPRKYLLPKTRLTLKFLCDFVHLRPRTNTIDSVAEEIERQKSTDDMIFLFGGVGPLHSDVSLAGVAKAFGVRLIGGSDKKKKKNLVDFKLGKERVKTKLSALAIAKAAQAMEVSINKHQRTVIG